MKNNLCTVYVVRHGQSVNNAKHDGGQEIFKKLEELGSELTNLGKEQAAKKAKYFKETKFDKVFSSDFIRARQTAEIIALEQKLEVETKSLIRERSWGSLEGYVTKEVKEKIKKLQEGLSDLEKMRIRIVKDAETDEEAMMRLVTFLREIATSYVGKTVLVVCHGNIMRSLLVHLGFAKFDELPNGALENTGHIKLESDGIEFFIREVVGINKKSV